MLPDDNLPFPPDLPGRAVAALRGDNAQKLQLTQELTSLPAAANEDQPLHAFYTTLQNAIFGADLENAGANLEGIYGELWESITTAVNNG